MTREISAQPKQTLQLLSKQDKNIEEYERLCLKDAELSFRAMEFGSLKYMGQVRLMPVYGQSDGTPGSEQRRAQQGSPDGQNDVVDYNYTKCGYGKLIWPDGSTFEGYWING